MPTCAMTLLLGLLAIAFATEVQGGVDMVAPVQISGPSAGLRGSHGVASSLPSIEWRPLVLTAPESNSDIDVLRNQVEQEKQRAAIAQVASRAAIKNATAEAALRKQVEVELAKSEPKLFTAREEAAKVMDQAKDLETQLKAALQRSAAAKAVATAAEKRAANANKELEEAKVSKPLRRATRPFARWLQACPNQKALAFVIGLVGLFSIVHPVMFLQAIAVGVFTIVVGIFASGEFHASWAAELPVWLDHVVGVEVAIVVALVTYIGFEGFQLVIGAVVGSFCACLAADNASLEVWDSAGGVSWYAMCSLAGVLLMYVLPRQSCAVTGPAIGGLMVSSCAGFFVADYYNVGALPSWLDELHRFLYGRHTVAGVPGHPAPLQMEWIILRSFDILVWIIVMGLAIANWYKNLNLPNEQDVHSDDSQENLEPWMAPPRRMFIGNGDNGQSKPKGGSSMFSLMRKKAPPPPPRRMY